MSVSATGFTAFTTFASPAYTSPANDTTASPNATVTRPTAGSGDATTITKSGTTGSYGLSTDDFMNLFLAELQNQDPTQPVDNAQMLTQLSQMSNIQTMQGIQTALEGSQLSAAANLIGKNVTGLDVNGSAVDGVVTNVTQSNDAGLVLKVGEQYIKPDSVVTVTAASSTGS
jgi:flagellar basal-body rod modification protein FlgD